MKSAAARDVDMLLPIERLTRTGKIPKNDLDESICIDTDR